MSYPKIISIIVQKTKITIAILEELVYNTKMEAEKWE